MEENQELSLPRCLCQFLNISSEPSKQSPEPSSKAPSMAEVEHSKAEDHNPETSKGKSQEQPIDSTPNTFSFQLSPAIKLKQAIAALSDSEFNKQGTAMIEVDKNSVELTVRNTETQVVGYLRLNAKGLLEFDVQKPLKRKMINLNDISQYLIIASDTDIITISHVDGYNNLCFKFGTRSTVYCSVQLLDIDDEFEKVPDINSAFECRLFNQQLLHFLNLLEAADQKLVSFQISDSAVAFFVGKKAFSHEYDTKKGGIKGIEEGAKHHAYFLWPHCEILRKGLLLVNEVLMCIISYQNNSIMWRFKLDELGDLAFMKKVTKFTANFKGGFSTSSLVQKNFSSLH